MMRLRRVIRQVILQEALDEGLINRLPKKLQAGIRELERLGLHIVSDWSPEEYDNGSANSIHLSVFDDLGVQKAYWIGGYQVEGACLDSYQCTNTNAQDLRGTGIGALLYDVACELTGEKGVSSDRNEVSPSAWRMWKYMTLNDQTYDIKGSYDWDGEQTPDDPSDDCFGVAWEQHLDHWNNPNNHPLNHVFVKKDRSRPTLACLELRKLIEYEE